MDHLRSKQICPAEETWYANALEASGVPSFALLCTAGWPSSQARRREIGAKGYRLGLGLLGHLVYALLH